MKKICTFIGAIVLIAGLAVGGYFLYNNVLKDKINEMNNKPFEIKYSHEKMLEGYDTTYNYVTGYTGKAIEDVVIAGKFTQDEKEYTTNAIRANAFKNNKTMKSIEIPANIIVLENNIFSGCENLRTITLKCTELDTTNIFISFNNFLDGLDTTNITFKVMNNDVKIEVEDCLARNSITGVTVEVVSAE